LGVLNDWVLLSNLGLVKDTSSKLNWNHHWLLNLDGGWLHLNLFDIVLLNLRVNSNSLLLSSMIKVVLKGLSQDFNSSSVIILLRNLQGLIVVFHLSLDSLEHLKLSHVAAHDSNNGKGNEHAAWKWMVFLLVMIFTLKGHRNIIHNLIRIVVSMVLVVLA